MLKQVADKETEILLDILREQMNVPGDVVEMGCYEGDSSLLFAEILRDNDITHEKKLWIYDSFEGLPEKSEKDFSEAGRDFREGELQVSKKYVKQRFLKAGLKVPVIKKAWFNELKDEDLPREICFSFLDGDLYESINDSLRLVTDKMNECGIIIVHDYNNEQLPGVTKAVDEWLKKHENCKLEVRESLAIISEK